MRIESVGVSELVGKNTDAHGHATAVRGVLGAEPQASPRDEGGPPPEVERRTQILDLAGLSNAVEKWLAADNGPMVLGQLDEDILPDLGEVEELLFLRNAPLHGLRDDRMVAISPSDVGRALTAGVTVQVADAHEHSAPIRDLTGVLRSAIGGQHVRANLYVAAQPGTRAVRTHSDPSPAVVVHLAGSKEWAVGNVAPIPRPRWVATAEEHQSEDDRARAAPVTRLTLRAGDVLALPWAAAHSAMATETAPIVAHLTFMMFPATVSEMAAAITARFAGSLVPDSTAMASPTDVHELLAQTKTLLEQMAGHLKVEHVAEAFGNRVAASASGLETTPWVSDERLTRDSRFVRTATPLFAFKRSVWVPGTRLDTDHDARLCTHYVLQLPPHAVLTVAEVSNATGLSDSDVMTYLNKAIPFGIVRLADEEDV